MIRTAIVRLTPRLAATPTATATATSVRCLSKKSSQGGSGAGQHGIQPVIEQSNDGMQRSGGDGMQRSGGTGSWWPHLPSGHGLINSFIPPIARNMMSLVPGFHGWHDTQLGQPFDPWSSPWTSWQPRVDIAENDKEYEVVIELPPGVKKEEVKLQLTSDDKLMVSGEKKREAHHKKGNTVMEERSFGSFSRTIQLPHDVDKKALQSIRARYGDDGLIRWSLPRQDARYIGIDDHSKGAKSIEKGSTQTQQSGGKQTQQSGGKEASGSGTFAAQEDMEKDKVRQEMSDRMLAEKAGTGPDAPR